MEATLDYLGGEQRTGLRSPLSEQPPMEGPNQAEQSMTTRHVEERDVVSQPDM